MQNKIIALATMVLMLVGCMNLGTPYPHESLNHLTVQAIYPDGFPSRSGAVITIGNVLSGVDYTLSTGADASATTALPDGIYRITVSDRDGLDVFNGHEDRVVLSGTDVVVNMQLLHARAGALVIKEIYSGGCPKTPEEGTYQSDQYVIVHNNSPVITYLDGLCMGSIAPYNSNASNPWLSPEGALPDFLPMNDAILMVPGDGDDFPLEPGEDAVMVLRGAIDHSAQYPLSVNLNQPDYFVCYNTTYFPNQTYHPAPGNRIVPERYLEVVIKTGQSNAYTLSLNSPAFVLFRADGTDIHQYVQEEGAVRQTPGSSIFVSAIPPQWVIDGVEVFNGSSSSNRKRLPASVDASHVTLSEAFKGRTVMRRIDAAASETAGYEILLDTNNSQNDLYERETQSLHE